MTASRPASTPDLGSHLLLLPDGAEGVGLCFVLVNPGTDPVTISYAQPFVAFSLHAEAEDGRVEVVQPAFSSGVRLRTETIEPAATVTINSPIRLVFDPHVAPHGGEVGTRWTLAHEPTRVRLTVTVQVDGATVPPCTAWWDPAEPPTVS